MGTVTFMRDFLQNRQEKLRTLDRNFLHMEFTLASSFLYQIDLTQLVRNAKGSDHWGPSVQPNVTDSLDRARFAYDQGQKIATRIRRVCAPYNTEGLEVETVRHIEQMAKRIDMEMQDGVSLPVLRREWDRSIDVMVERLTDFTLPLLTAANRSGAPSPRSA